MRRSGISRWFSQMYWRNTCAHGLVNHVAKPYAEWLAEKSGQPTWRTAIRQDVDEAIQQSLTWRQFLNALDRKGYEVRMGRKYPVLRPPGKERFVRFKTLGKGRSGSYSINHQQSGRDLMTPDEVRLLDNSKCILFIRGERPVVDSNTICSSIPTSAAPRTAARLPMTTPPPTMRWTICPAHPKIMNCWIWTIFCPPNPQK